MALAKSNTNDLASLFKEGFFKIPPYQRRYSWSEKQQLDLYNDLFESFQTKTIHFLGTLSLQLTDTVGFDSFYNIIDGQQRFTTLIILYSCLARRINDTRYIDYIKNNNEYFLEPIDSNDKKYFQDILDGKQISPSSISQKNMYSARDNFEKKIKKLSSAEALDYINHILNYTSFLIYLVEDYAESIRMFETINDRGLPLSYFDKIKSFFLYYSNKYLNDDLNEVIDESFKVIYSFFDNDNLVLKINNDDTLLLYNYLSNPLLFTNWSYTKSTGKIFVDLKKYLIELVKNDLETGKKFIKEYLEDIVLFISSVETIEEKINNNIVFKDFYLYLLPNQRMFPLSIRLNLLGLLDDSIHLLEKIEFYLKFRRDPKKDIFKILKEIMESDKQKDEILLDLNNQLYYIWEWQTDEIDIINNANWAAKFVLYKYNKKLNNQIVNEIEYKTLEIEHIFSQEPSFPIEEYNYNEESYKHYLNKIGNLTLLEKKLNIKASNKTPIDKIDEVYLHSNIEITNSINIKNKIDIENRCSLIEKFAQEYFLFELK